jgi:hypothetical protein
MPKGIPGLGGDAGRGGDWVWDKGMPLGKERGQAGVVFAPNVGRNGGGKESLAASIGDGFGY